MKRFRFKFAAVEGVRKRAENEALRALGEAQRAFQLAVQFKEHLHQQLQKALVRRESLGSEPVRAVAFRLENDFIAGTKQRIIQAEQFIINRKRGVEKALRHYLGARKQLKMIETLKQKHFEEFKKEAAKREQREMDDLSVMRARFREREDVLAGAGASAEAGGV